MRTKSLAMNDRRLKPTGEVRPKAYLIPWVVMDRNEVWNPGVARRAEPTWAVNDQPTAWPLNRS
jgi:hypothetical protein